MGTDERVERSRQLYERALFYGDLSALGAAERGRREDALALAGEAAAIAEASGAHGIVRRIEAARAAAAASAD